MAGWADLSGAVRLARGAAADRHGELVRLLKALGDDTRLRALRLIAERPRSTQELAPLVGISEAGLSKHLRLLAECGVLESRREGYDVLYSLRAERLEPLSQTVLSFLGGGAE